MEPEKIHTDLLNNNVAAQIDYGQHLTFNDAFVSYLRDALQVLRKSNNQPEVTFKSLRKKEQNSLIMKLLSRVNNQILKFNLKKLLQIWAIYHPEDTNCQIIANMMFKKSGKVDIETIKQELRSKNKKIRRNSTINSKRFSNSTSEAYFPYSASAYAVMRVVEEKDLGVTAKKSNVSGKYKRRHQSFFQIPPMANLQLFRAIDSRGILHCTKLFDQVPHHIRDLPLIMCYTDHHIEKLIEICQHSKSFPFHLLPVYLRKPFEMLMRL